MASWKAVLASVFIGWPAVSYASFMDGNKFLEVCKSAQGEGFCQGFVAAIVDGQEAMYAALKSQRIQSAGIVVCVPQSVTIGQARAVAVQFLEQHPEQRHYGAASLVIGALAMAFPCNASR